MAHRPCSRVLSVPGLVSPEEVDLPVEVRLEPRGDIPREVPKVALEQGAQVAHQLHPLKVNRVVDVRPVCLALDPPLDSTPRARSRSWMSSDPGAFLPKIGWAFGQILCLSGKRMAFGNLPIPKSLPVI